jgi:predicted NUDIX family NTP pyrophosphohydrolase
MEWPPRSGKRKQFPEVDQALFFSEDVARRKIKPAQVPFLDRLPAVLN